ncbi:MAG TPA: fibronectin type III domain-containing protein, partial [Bacteroidales bacterium]|nr:fibronectin type III domain-containing protein [Bacteroidales bacterium]
MKKTISIILVIMIVLLVNACKKKQEPPTVVTEAATDITTTSFTAGGNVTDDGGDQIATRGICWDISDLPTIEKNILKVSGETGSFTCTISGLEPKTQYYVRAYATNSEGTSYGKPVSLTTLGDVPLTTVVDASDIGLYSAKLNGKINPHALSTEVVFQWGTTTDYGNGVSAIETPVTGNNQVSVSALLTGLDPGTTYHYRLVANNDLGTSQSEDISFTTNGSKPDIVIGDVTDIQVDGGKLNTVVNANYLETDVSFEWGTDTNYGNTITPASSPVSGNSDIDLSQVISGLTEGTVYHFRVVATNILGTTYSDDEKFTTLGKPAVATLGATEITTNSALTGGKIISDFGSPVTEMGICWSLSHDPAITDNKVMNDALADSFNISLSGLDPNTVYYVRAYAINDIGLSYGEEAIIKTYTGTI